VKHGDTRARAAMNFIDRFDDSVHLSVYLSLAFPSGTLRDSLHDLQVVLPFLSRKKKLHHDGIPGIFLNELTGGLLRWVL